MTFMSVVHVTLYLGTILFIIISIIGLVLLCVSSVLAFFLAFSNKNRVGLFSGSFNPIGKHHVALVELLLKYGHVDHVIFIPTYQTTGKKLEDGSHRLEMCKIAVSDNKNISVSDFDIKNRLCCGSLDMIKKFMAEHKQYSQFYLITGADNALGVPEWISGEELIKTIKFIVPARPNFNAPADAWFLKTPHIYVPACDDTGSSTRARDEYILTGTTELLDSMVLDYIKRNKLYITSKI